jgi:hypothetical protein
VASPNVNIPRKQDQLGISWQRVQDMVIRMMMEYATLGLHDDSFAALIGPDEDAGQVIMSIAPPSRIWFEGFAIGAFL